MPAELVRIGAKTGDVLPPEPIAIDVTDVDISGTSATCWAALRASQTPPFVRFGSRPCVWERNEWVVLTPPSLKFWLSRFCRFYKVLKSGDLRYIQPPSWVIHDMLADPNPDLRVGE
jgi:hypothetical protein